MEAEARESGGTVVGVVLGRVLNMIFHNFLVDFIGMVFMDQNQTPLFARLNVPVQTAGKSQIGSQNILYLQANHARELFVIALIKGHRGHAWKNTEQKQGLHWQQPHHHFFAPID